MGIQRTLEGNMVTVQAMEPTIEDFIHGLRIDKVINKNLSRMSWSQDTRHDIEMEARRALLLAAYAEGEPTGISRMLTPVFNNMFKTNVSRELKLHCEGFRFAKLEEVEKELGIDINPQRVIDTTMSMYTRVWPHYSEFVRNEIWGYGGINTGTLEGVLVRLCFPSQIKQIVC